MPDAYASVRAGLTYFRNSFLFRACLCSAANNESDFEMEADDGNNVSDVSRMRTFDQESALRRSVDPRAFADAVLDAALA